MAEIKLLTDEDIKRAIIDGIRLRLPLLDIVRMQDVGLRTFRDERILEFAAVEGRIVISHDLNTMKAHAENRLLLGKPMPGLFLIRQDVPIGRAIEEIVLIAECSQDEEWHNKIRFLPL